VLPQNRLQRTPASIGVSLMQDETSDGAGSAQLNRPILFLCSGISLRAADNSSWHAAWTVSGVERSRCYVPILEPHTFTGNPAF